MKRVIRKQVFETNSSMSHSLIILPKEISDEWVNSINSNLWLFYYDRDSTYEKLENKPIQNHFYTTEEVVNFLKAIGCYFEYADIDGLSKEEQEEEFLRDEAEYHGFYNYEEWVNDEYLETDYETYITPGGETIVIHSKYGGNY